MGNNMRDLDPRRVHRVTASDAKTGRQFTLEYTNSKSVGNGSFGVVYQAQLVPSGEMVAIKKVLQDKRFKNRELAVMRAVAHGNVVALKSFFYCEGENKSEVYLNLVLEFVPQTIYRLTRNYHKARIPTPLLEVKLYMYQLFRALAYIHAVGICHRDIKPQNLLIDPQAGILKLCDFGSAKALVRGAPNVSYICSRYYRAPELIFGAVHYTTKIDVWSAGCVMAEMILGYPLFPGESGIDQLVEIIKVLGTPSWEQIRSMNPKYQDHHFPSIQPHSFSRIFGSRVPPEALGLLKKVLDYTPTARISAIQAMAHPFFDELRTPGLTLSNNRPLPNLFDFTPAELSIAAELRERLVPPHVIPELAARGIDLVQFQPVAIAKVGPF